MWVDHDQRRLVGAGGGSLHHACGDVPEERRLAAPGLRHDQLVAMKELPGQVNGSRAALGIRYADACAVGRMAGRGRETLGAGASDPGWRPCLVGQVPERRHFVRVEKQREPFPGAWAWCTRCSGAQTPARNVVVCGVPASRPGGEQRQPPGICSDGDDLQPRRHERRGELLLHERRG